MPSLFVGETYTDNVSLAPDDQKRSDWITQVAPGISVGATGSRLQFNATYAAEILVYARDEESNQVNHLLEARGTGELLEELFFLEGGASIEQRNISLFAPLTGSNINTTGNRSTVESVFASPYFKHEFGTDFGAEAR